MIDLVRFLLKPFDTNFKSNIFVANGEEQTSNDDWAVVVAQLEDQPLPMPEVSSWNRVIGILLYRTFVYCIQKTKNEKQAGTGPFFKKVLIICIKRIVIFRFSGIPGGERRPRVEGSVQKVPQKHQRALNSAKRNPIFVPERPLLKRQIKP